MFWLGRLRIRFCVAVVDFARLVGGLRPRLSVSVTATGSVPDMRRRSGGTLSGAGAAGSPQSGSSGLSGPVAVRRRRRVVVVAGG